MRKSLSTVYLALVLLFAVSAIAADKVVVVPLGGAVGNATVEDVVKGKTFSNSMEKGLTGTLKLNPAPTGDAVAADVLEGKTFSNEDDIGITGTRPIAPVAKTGQTTSYAIGDDGDLEKGVAWPNPRFTDNNDGTVTDNLTGLIWLQVAVCTQTIAGIDNSSKELPWLEALIWTNGLENGFCELTDGSTAGVWRLPNKKELESLLDFAYLLPALSNDAGTGHWQEDETSAFAAVMSTGYWTSTSYAGDAGNAWYVHLASGALMSSTKMGSHGVWPVRD